MPRQAKTPKFRGFDQLDNCFNQYKGEDWHEYWSERKPVTLELGCGKAELLLELARTHRDRNHVGVDVKTDRMYKPARAAKEEGLDNIAFVRANAGVFDEVFRPGEIDELWITFPDPYPKKRAAKHRLLHPSFLPKYQQALSRDSELHFKTDNKTLFDWGLEQLEADKSFNIQHISRDLHADVKVEDKAKILTTYERKFRKKGQPIYYVKAVKLT